LPPGTDEAGRLYRIQVLLEVSKDESFVLLGEWETRSDWERHLNSENYAVLLGSLELLSNEKGLDSRLLSPVEATTPLHGMLTTISAT
jgi:hypothetical protein